MSAVIAPDPGPLARFRVVVEDPETMAILAQRLTDGETLRDISKSWKVPYGKLCEWITEDRQRAEQYSAALRFAAESFVHEVVVIADSVVEDKQAIAKARLRISAREWVAGKWDRSKYGDSAEVRHTGSVSLMAVLSSLPRGEVDITPAVPALEAPAPEAENVPQKNSAQKNEAPATASADMGPI